MSKEGSIDRLMRVLEAGLDYPTRRVFEGRTRKMLNDVGFLVQCEHEKTLIVIREGWTPDAIGAVCVLSVFYQVVLGPIASSARSCTGCGVGVAIPIRYGGLELFDSGRAARVNEMHDTFMRMVGKLNIGRFWLEKSSADDLIFQMACDLEGEGRDHE